jgi:hypothetical protein
LFFIISLQYFLRKKKAPRSFACSYLGSGGSLEINKLKNLKNLVQDENKCVMPAINWKKEWVYLYRTECPSASDQFRFKNYTEGKLTIVHEHLEDQGRLNPDIRCNKLAVCGQNGVAVIFNRNQKVASLEVEMKLLPCDE